MNHMVCDAAGFKAYLYFLCTIYSGLMDDPTYRPTAITGDRSMRMVLRRLGVGVKFKSLFLQSGENNRTGGDRFPLSERGEARPFILTRKLERERTAALKDYGRAKGATLNDVVLTAFYRCLFQQTGAEARRQAPDTGDGGHASLPWGNRGIRVPDQSHLNAEHAVSLQTRGALRGHACQSEGSHGREEGEPTSASTDLSSSACCMGYCGDRIANRWLKSSLKNPLICMTNVGILDAGPNLLWGTVPI